MDVLAEELDRYIIQGGIKDTEDTGEINRENRSGGEDEKRW